MARKAASHPTEVELQILGVLWWRGPSTVRQIHNILKDKRDTGYSTTLKMVQVMTEKGLLLKNDTTRPQIYKPAISENKAQTHLVDDLIQRAFGGAVDKLILRAITSRYISSENLKQIKELIRKLEGDSK